MDIPYPARCELQASPCIPSQGGSQYNHRLYEILVRVRRYRSGWNSYLEETEDVYIPRPNLKKARPSAVPALAIAKDPLTMQQSRQEVLLHGVFNSGSLPSIQRREVP